MVRDVKGVRTAILVVVVVVVVQRDAEVGARGDAEEVVVLRLIGIPVQHGSDRVLCKRASDTRPTNQRARYKYEVQVRLLLDKKKPFVLLHKTLATRITRPIEARLLREPSTYFPT